MNWRLVQFAILLLLTLAACSDDGITPPPEPPGVNDSTCYVWTFDTTFVAPDSFVVDSLCLVKY